MVWQSEIPAKINPDILAIFHFLNSQFSIEISAYSPESYGKFSLQKRDFRLFPAIFVAFQCFVIHICFPVTLKLLSFLVFAFSSKNSVWIGTKVWEQNFDTILKFKHNRRICAVLQKLQSKDEPSGVCHKRRPLSGIE